MPEALIEKDRADEEAYRNSILGLCQLPGVFRIWHIDKQQQRPQYNRGHDRYDQREFYVKDKTYKA